MKFLIAVPLTIALVYWCLSNLQLVGFSYMPLSENAELPLAFIILGSFSLGFIVATLLFWLNTIPQSMKRHKLKKENKKMQKELDEYKEEEIQL